MRQRVNSLRPGTDLPDIVASFRAQKPEMAPGGEPRSWYSIKNLGKDETEVYIYDEIGMWGVTASDFLNDLAAISTPKIALRINSPGGDVFDGIAIYNAINRHEADVTGYVDGLAASAASFIAMAADTLVMSPKSQMMIHDAYGFAMGPAEDMRKMAEMLDKTSDNIASIYADKAGGTVEEWRERMRAESWFNDQEAVDAGLADRIDGEDDEAVAARLEARIKAQAEPEPIEPEEPEPAPAPIDFTTVFEEIVEDDDIYAVA